MLKIYLFLALCLLLSTISTCVGGRSDFEKLYPKSEEEKAKDKAKSIREKLYDEVPQKPVDVTPKSQLVAINTSQPIEQTTAELTSSSLVTSQLAIVLFLSVVGKEFEINLHVSSWIFTFEML